MKATLKLTVSRVSHTSEATAAGKTETETVRLEPVTVKGAGLALTTSSAITLRITDTALMGQFVQGAEIVMTLTSPQAGNEAAPSNESGEESPRSSQNP